MLYTEIVKQEFSKLESFQNTLPDDYVFEKYEDFYDDEKCYNERFKYLEDGSILYTWDYTDYDEAPQMGLWFKLTQKES